MKLARTDREGYKKQLFYFSELLKAYGDKNILLKNEEGGYYQREAREYIGANFYGLGIKVRIPKKNQISWRAKTKEELSPEQLTYVFFKALADIKRAYLDDFKPSEEGDELILENVRKSYETNLKYLESISEWSVDLPELFPFTADGAGDGAKERKTEIIACLQKLASMGCERMDNMDHLDYMFWRFAYLGEEITQSMRDAMVSLTIKSELRDYIDYQVDKFNYALRRQKKESESERHIRMKKESEDSKLKQQIELIKIAEKKKALDEREEMLKAYSKKKMQHYKDKIKDLKINNEGRHNLSRILIKKLSNTSDPFFKSYNLNNEKDIREYISWFDAALVSIKASLSRKLLEDFITEESAKQLFIDLVKQTNDKIQEKLFVVHFEI